MLEFLRSVPFPSIIHQDRLDGNKRGQFGIGSICASVTEGIDGLIDSNAHLTLLIVGGGGGGLIRVILSGSDTACLQNSTEGTLACKLVSGFCYS